MYWGREKGSVGQARVRWKKFGTCLLSMSDGAADSPWDPAVFEGRTRLGEEARRLVCWQTPAAFLCDLGEHSGQAGEEEKVKESLEGRDKKELEKRF